MATKMENLVGVYFAIFAVLGANSLCFWKSAVKTLIYMKIWKTKFPIFCSIRLKISESVTFQQSAIMASQITPTAPQFTQSTLSKIILMQAIMETTSTTSTLQVLHSVLFRLFDKILNNFEVSIYGVRTSYLKWTGEYLLRETKLSFFLCFFFLISMRKGLDRN